MDGVRMAENKLNNRYFLFLLLAIFVLMAACEGMPAAKINPNPPDGDQDGEQSEIENDGDMSESSEDAEEDVDSYIGDTSELALDEELQDDEVRAGEVGNPESELPQGPQAAGQDGDFKLYNSKVAFIIQSDDEERGWSGFNGSGGTIIDAVLLDENGDAGQDMLVEYWPVVEMDAFAQGIEFGTFRHFKVSSVKLIHNGSDGDPAIVRAEGTDWGNPLPDKYSELLSYPPNPHTRIVVDYILESGATYLKINVKAVQETDEDDLIEVLTLGGGLLTSPEQKIFVPGRAEDSLPDDGYNNFEIQAAFSYSSEVSYAIVAHNAGGLHMAKFDKRPLYLTGNEFLTLKNGGMVSSTMLFYVGDGDPDKLYSAINKQGVDEDKTDAFKAVSVSGTLSIPSILEDQHVRIIARDPIGKKVYSITRPYGSGDQATFSFNALPSAKRFEILAKSNIGGEGEASEHIILGASDSITDQLLSPPAAPAEVYISVTSLEPTGAQPIPARVDFFKPEDYSARRKPMFSASIGAEQPQRVLVPLDGQDSYLFHVLASRGLFYNLQAKWDVNLQNNPPEGEVQSLEFTIRPTLDKGPIVEIDGDEETDGDIDGTEITEEEQTEDNVPTISAEDPTPIYISTGLGLCTDKSLDCENTSYSQVHAALANGYRAISIADRNTYSNISSTVQELGLENKLASMSSMEVEVPDIESLNQGGYYTSGISISLPDGLPEYGPVNTFSYLDTDGGFNGLIPPPGVWETLRSDFSASIIHQSRLRAPKGSGGLLDRYGSEGSYDPHAGKSSLDSLVADYLNQWNTVELLGHDVGFAYFGLALQDWASLIAEGKKLSAVGFSNARANNENLGYPVNLVILSDPAWDGSSGKLTSAIKQGKSILAGGPSIKISIDGVGIGETYTPDSLPADDLKVNVRVKIEAPAWIPLNSISIAMNGKHVWPDDATLLTITASDGLRFDEVIPIPLEKEGETYKDAWIVAFANATPSTEDMEAAPDSDSAPGYTLCPVYDKPSFSMTNPIYVDANQDGEFNPTGLLPDSEIYLFNSSICALFSMYDRDGSVGIKNKCCAKYEGAAYCD